jgi:hypothetical protein
MPLSEKPKGTELEYSPIDEQTKYNRFDGLQTDREVIFSPTTSEKVRPVAKSNTTFDEDEVDEF